MYQQEGKLYIVGGYSPSGEYFPDSMTAEVLTVKIDGSTGSDLHCSGNILVPCATLRYAINFFTGSHFSYRLVDYLIIAVGPSVISGCVESLCQIKKPLMLRGQTDPSDSSSLLTLDFLSDPKRSLIIATGTWKTKDTNDEEQYTIIRGNIIKVECDCCAHVYCHCSCTDDCPVFMLL